MPSLVLVTEALACPTVWQGWATRSGPPTWGGKWATREGLSLSLPVMGKAGQAGPAGRGKSHSAARQAGEVAGETEHQPSLETPAALDTYLLKDDNEINPACSHFPSK